MGNKVIKSVSFNLTVSEDAAMLKHFKRRNFSGYVKKLIWADMQKGTDKPAVTDHIETEKVVETKTSASTPIQENNADRLEMIRQQAAKQNNHLPLDFTRQKR
jgi:hypothetical protein